MFFRQEQAPALQKIRYDINLVASATYWVRKHISSHHDTSKISKEIYINRKSGFAAPLNKQKCGAISLFTSLLHFWKAMLLKKFARQYNKSFLLYRNVNSYTARKAASPHRLTSGSAKQYRFSLAMCIFEKLCFSKNFARQYNQSFFSV